GETTQLLWVAPPNFMFIDSDLNTHRPSNAVSGRVLIQEAPVKPSAPKTETDTETDRNDAPSEVAPPNNLKSGIAAPLPRALYPALLAGPNITARRGLAEVYDLWAW